MKKLLFFTASWCSACKAIKPVVEKEATEKGFDVKYVDMDDEEGAYMADEFNVRNLPTLIVLDKQGVEIKRAVGNTAWKEVQE
jgi:thiol-disulfide isomerase/thioredoxin